MKSKAFQVFGQKIQSLKDHLCYDITSISCAEQNEYVRNGYNRDKEALPLSFRMLTGSIYDVVTV